MRFIYIFGFLIVSVLLQHTIHELMHVYDENYISYKLDLEEISKFTTQNLEYFQGIIEEMSDVESIWGCARFTAIALVKCLKDMDLVES